MQYFQFLVWLLLAGVIAPAYADETSSFQEAFDKHNSTMLLIDPGNGAIVDANPSASKFYGYTRKKLRTMKIQEINQFTAAQVAEERKQAATEGRNFFIFRHQLFDGSIRTVEVNSSPIDYQGRKILFSIIRDISKERSNQEELWYYQSRLEEMVDQQTQAIKAGSNRTIIQLMISVALLMVLVASLLWMMNKRKVAELSLRESEELQRRVLNNTSSIIYIKDLDGRYMLVNRQFEVIVGVKNDDIRGKTDHDVFSTELADAFCANDLEARNSGMPIEFEEAAELGGEHYNFISVKFPLKHADGEVYAVCGISTDITGRVEAEKRIRENEEQLKASQNVARLGHYNLDVTSGTWTNSKALDDIFGIDKDFNRTVDGWLALVHPYFREAMQSYIQDEVFAKHQPFDRQYKIIDKATQMEKWVHGLGKLEFDENNSPVRMFGTIQDITANKLAEEKFSAAFHAAGSLMTISILENGEYEDVNDTFVQITGYSREDAIGKTSVELGFISDDDREALRQILVNEGRVSNLQLQLKRKDGSKLYCLYNGEIISFGDKKRLLSIAQDITDRVAAERLLSKSEERFHNLLNSTAEGIFGLDLDGNCTFCNPASLRLLGYEDDQDLLGKNMHELAHFCHENGSPYPEEECLIYQAFKKGEGTHSSEEVFWRKNGSSMPVEYWSYPLREEGELVGAVVTFFDITGRRMSQRQLLEAKDEAEFANKAKSEFLASMSHELRTPLNAVLGFAQMLQHDPQNVLTAAQNEHTDSIIEGGYHLLDLVNEILDLAKIEANQLEFSFSEVEACNVIEECIALVTPLGKQRNITLVDQYCREKPTLLRTDHKRLKQALINLLSNAVKFNKDGGSVFIDADTTDDGFLRIKVEDTGIGIAKEDFSSVFQLFHRLDADPMVSREGTGIGLTVTKLIVERMAGSIGFESEEGVGSTFWIELPLVTNNNVLIWSDAMRIGIDALDKDHQVIATLLNRIAHQNIDDEALDEVIKSLTDYTYYHFQREEAIMKAIDYPGFDEHVERHRLLSLKVGEMADKWEAERDSKILYNLREFLQNLLYTDILKTDSDIAQHVKGKDRHIREALEKLENKVSGK